MRERSEQSERIINESDALQAWKLLVRGRGLKYWGRRSSEVSILVVLSEFTKASQLVPKFTDLFQ